MPKRVPYTQRSLKLLRDMGFDCGIVERYIFATKIRIDLFGIIDLIAIRDGRIVGVQTTSWAGRRKHLETLASSNKSDLWLRAGAELWLICWKKEKIKRGGKAFRYAGVVEYLTLDALKDLRLRLNIKVEQSDGGDVGHCAAVHDVSGGVDMAGAEQVSNLMREGDQGVPKPFKPVLVK